MLGSSNENQTRHDSIQIQEQNKILRNKIKCSKNKIKYTDRKYKWDKKNSKNKIECSNDEQEQNNVLKKYYLDTIKCDLVLKISF